MTQEPEPLKPHASAPNEPSYAPTGKDREARRASRAGRTTPKFVAADDTVSRPTPLVSVIVTVHDASETVRFCVDSILRQSYANLEVILVDDGSDDDGPAILDEYARRDRRVKALFLKDVADAVAAVGSGVVKRSAADAAADRDAERGDVAARARNTGLNAAHGEYVAFAGSDGVLDRRNIELLLHALIRTGADMAKSRIERFTGDQLYAVAEASAEGAHEPESVTVFANVLEAYQTVFLKSLRVLGDEFGRNTEARFLHDDDWGRLYRMSVWDGVRLPEGIYSPELLAAGELYSRMAKVVDLDTVLYRRRMEGTGRPASGTGTDTGVTGRDSASISGEDLNGGLTGDLNGDADGDMAGSSSRGDAPKPFRYYHDTFTAGTANFRFAFEQGILPIRSYATMTTAYEEAKSSPDFDTEESQRQFAMDTDELGALRGMLTFTQRVQCGGARRMGLFEESARRFMPASMSRSRYTPVPDELAE